MVVKRMAMTGIGILALFCVHPVFAVAFGWQQDAITIDLAPDDPVVVAITPFEVAEHTPKLSARQSNKLQLRAWGLSLALSRMLSDTQSVSIFDTEHMRPGMKAIAFGSREAKHIDVIVTGSLRQEDLGYVLSYRLQSGHTGGILGTGEIWFPRAGNQINATRELAWRVLKPLDHAPTKAEKNAEWSGWLLENLGFLWSVTPENARKIPRGSYDNALLALMEGAPEATLDWLQHNLLAAHVDTVATELGSAAPLLRLAQGRKVDAKNRAEALVSKLRSKRAQKINLCLLTRLVREMGLLDQATGYLKSLQKLDPDSSCTVLEEAMALASRGGNERQKAVARLQQHIEAGNFTVYMLNALKELDPGSMPPERYRQLRAERLYTLGSPQSFMELRASRFLEKPNKRLLSVLECENLTPETRKNVFTRLEELKLTGDMEPPKALEKLMEEQPLPVYRTPENAAEPTLTGTVKSLLSFIPDNAGRIMLLSHASCPECRRFATRQLQSADVWLTPLALKTLQQRFTVQMADDDLVSRIVKDPGAAETIITQTAFDNAPETFVLLDAGANAYLVSEETGPNLPVHLTLSVFQPGTGLRFSVGTDTYAPRTEVTTTNFLLVITLVIIATILLVMLVILRFFLKIRKDPRRHAAVLARNGQFMEAASMLRDAGFVQEAEKVMAEHFEAQGKLEAAIGHYLHAGLPKKVLELYPGIVKKTTEVFTIAAEASIALDRFAKARDYYRFAGNEMGVAKTFELEGNVEAAAKLRAEYYERAENYRAAVDEYIGIKDFDAAANLCFNIQDYRSAAVLYAQGGKLNMVEKCFLRMGKRLDISKLKRIDIHNLFGNQGDIEL